MKFLNFLGKILELIFERIRMVRMVRMVRSLADRTFQLWFAVVEIDPDLDSGRVRNNGDVDLAAIQTALNGGEARIAFFTKG